MDTYRSKILSIGVTQIQGLLLIVTGNILNEQMYYMMESLDHIFLKQPK